MLSFSFIEGASTKEFEKIVGQEMGKPLEHFESELTKIRTGRAHPALVADIRFPVASYGGSMMALKDLAAISTPEAQLLVIQPWDKSLMSAIEKALIVSDIGITPVNDGSVIRLSLPKMSGTRREELNKVVTKKLEECRVAMRAIRKDAHNSIRSAERDKKISEDYGKRIQAGLEKVTGSFIEKAEQIAQRKEKEILSL